MKKKKENNKDSKYTFGRFIWLMGFVFAAWLVSGVSIYFSIGSWDGPGTFGDMFGAINALFSGLAFAGIIFTILLQREELKLQRKELELTREEISRTASAQEASQKELSKQAETLQKTAQINAIDTLLRSYEKEIERSGLASVKKDEARINYGICKSKLESLLEVLDNDNPA